MLALPFGPDLQWLVTVIHIPPNMNDETMYPLISSIIGSDGRPIVSDLTLDFGSLEFIEPVGVTILSNVIEWLKKGGIATRVQLGQGPIKRAIRYLDDSRFFERYHGSKLFSGAHVRSTTIPLMLVEYERSQEWIASNFGNWLMNRLKMNAASIANITMSIAEIFTNIKDHSQERIGCIFVQHFPRGNEIKIAISDFGVGIPHKVRKHEQKQMTDSMAILMATKEGYSTWSTPHNRGAGLDFLISNIVLNNRGELNIHSGEGLVNFKNQAGKISPSPKKRSGFYPGTLVHLMLRTDTIQQEQDEEAFTW